MSDQPDEMLETEIGAEAIRSQAADWLMDRRVADDWSPGDQAALDAWLAESISHRLAYWRLEATWDRTYRLAALRQTLRSQTGNSGTSEKPTVIKIAAAIIVFSALAGAAALYSLMPVERTFATGTGERQIIKLADGSSVELNTETILRISKSPAGRSVTLDKGEAYFQIKHDAAHPFLVVAGNHRITDLGTIFEVRKDPGHLKIELLEGSARVDATQATHPTSATLTPGDVVIATADDLTVTKKTSAQLSNDLAWRRGLLVFNNTPLADVVAELNRYSATKLVVADAETGKIGIGGTFPANNTTAFVRIAHELLGLRVESRGNEMVISR